MLENYRARGLSDTISSKVLRPSFSLEEMQRNSSQGQGLNHECHQALAELGACVDAGLRSPSKGVSKEESVTAALGSFSVPLCFTCIPLPSRPSVLALFPGKVR